MTLRELAELAAAVWELAGAAWGKLYEHAAMEALGLQQTVLDLPVDAFVGYALLGGFLAWYLCTAK